MALDEVIRIPAEIWQVDNYNVSKIFKFEKQVKTITLDPFLETADVNLDNNYWPPKIQPTRLELYKQRMNGSSNYNGGGNPMQRAGSETH